MYDSIEIDDDDDEEPTPQIEANKARYELRMFICLCSGQPFRGV